MKVQTLEMLKSIRNVQKGHVFELRAYVNVQHATRNISINFNAGSLFVAMSAELTRRAEVFNIEL